MPTAFLDRELKLSGASLTSSAAVIGNGHLELRPDRTGFGAGPARLGTRPTFDATHVAPTSPAAVAEQRLHLASGVWSASLTDATATRLRALRQLPNCALQSLTGAPGTRVEHVVRAPPGGTLERGDHLVLNVDGARVPCLCMEARTGGGWFGYACAYIGGDAVDDAVYEGAASDDGGGTTRDYATLGPSGALHLLHAHVESSVSGAAAGFRARDLIAVAVRMCGGRATALASANTRRWAALWTATMRVEPRPSAAADAAIASLNLALETALYRILSAVRDDVAYGIDTPVNREPWSSAHGIAALVALRPRAAMPVLVSAVFAPDTPLRSLARHATDVWAIFRATLDREWLRATYPSVQAAVDEITVRIEVASDDDGGGILDSASAILVKYAYEAAVQASYELRVRPRSEWVSADSRLEMPVDRSMIRGDADADLALAMHPFAFRTALGAQARVLQDNAASTELALRGSTAVTRLAGVAVAATPTNAPLADLATALLAETTTGGGWKFAGDAVGLDVACSLVSCVAWGFARSRVTGYVSSDGFHMQTAGITRPRLAPLPPTWAAIRFRQAIAGSGEFLTSNSSS